MTIVADIDPCPWATRHYQHWTPAEDVRLADLITAGRTIPQIARTLKRRPGAIIAQMGRARITLRCGRYSANEVARLLGIDVHAVTWWRNRGWLRARTGPTKMGKYPFCFVTHDALVAFLADESYWHLWEPDRVTDSALREWVQEMRAGIRFLTTGEAGKILCMSHYGVNMALREGRLRGVKRGANWFVRSDQLVLVERGWRKGRPFTAAEEEYVRQWWRRKPATEIARDLGERSDGGVARVAKRLGLGPGLGRGYWRSPERRTESA